jgi:hypothetical protein
MPIFDINEKSSNIDADNNYSNSSKALIDGKSESIITSLHCNGKTHRRIFR